MTMHLENRLSTINLKKYKTKITKGKLKELELRWRQHNRDMKRNHMHDMRYDTLQEYIDYSYGKTKMPDQRDYRNFKPLQNESSWRAQKDDEHREKYPSLMEQQMKEGTFNSDSMSQGTKKEPMMYTGDLIQGIATMHKSNAVPVMKGTDQAKDIARMRRG